ncbi:MAG: hypothetical protein ACRDQZ_10160, partial [Mycobacteriales bacterium]
VYNSNIKAVGAGSQIHLLGRVDGNSTITAESYTNAFSRRPGVAFRGREGPMPDHLRQLAPQDPPLLRLSDVSGGQRPRSPLASRARWLLSGPAPYDSLSHHRRPRRKGSRS